jgi:Predicted hydrolase (metallo-beta-lactamase superfamily)
MSLVVKFYDVEHGSCTQIITPNGKHYLVDIGTKSSKSISRHLKNKYFQYQGGIDYLVITHPHIDHIADLENLYTYNIKPRVLWRAKDAFPLSVSYNDSPAQASLKRKANSMNEEYNSLVNASISPTNFSWSGGLEIDLFPATVVGNEKDDLNFFSCILVLKYSGFKIVLTGDNPASKLEEMLKGYSFRQAISNATVLLAPHHGRDSDFCENFVKTVNPILTVFSDKPIQHETQAHATQRYYNLTRGTTWGGEPRRVFTTRSDGTITFTFDNNDIWHITTSTAEY